MIMLWLWTKPLKSIAPSVTKENSLPQSLFWYLGNWNQKLFKYFYRMSWMSYKSELLENFILFLFWMSVCWISCSVVVVWTNLVFFWLFFNVILAHFYCYLNIYLFIYLLKLKIMFEGPRLFLWVVRDTTKFHNNSNIRIQKNFKLETKKKKRKKKAHVWVGMLILECYEIVVRFYCVPSITLIFIC